MCGACLGPYRDSVALGVRAARKCVVLISAEPVAGIGLSESERAWAGYRKRAPNPRVGWEGTQPEEGMRGGQSEPFDWLRTGFAAATVWVSHADVGGPSPWPSPPKGGEGMSQRHSSLHSFLGSRMERMHGKLSRRRVPFRQ